MRPWLAWTGTAICWVTAPFVVYIVLGAALVLWHPFVEHKLWALIWFAVAALWCAMVWMVTAAHQSNAAMFHFLGCNIGALLGFAWFGLEMLAQR